MRNQPGPIEPEDADPPSPEASSAGGQTTDVIASRKLTGLQVLTLAGLAIMAISVIDFGATVGIVSICIDIILATISPAAGKAALAKVSWSMVILITGVLTYIYILEEAGTVSWISDGIMKLGVPLLAAILLFYLAGFVSALASSLGIIGVVNSLAVPFLASGDVNVAGFVAALAIAATIVDISPFSTNGAMLLSNVDSSVRDAYYRKMLGYAALMCTISPGLA